MTTKEKIALHAMMQKVQRGILSEDQAKIEFKRITGRDPDFEPEEGDEDAKELGKYLQHLIEALPVPDPDPEEDQEKTVEIAASAQKTGNRRKAAKMEEK